MTFKLNFQQQPNKENERIAINKKHEKKSAVRKLPYHSYRRMREVERRKCDEILKRLGVNRKTVFPATTQNPNRPRNCSPELDEQIKLALVRAEEKLRMNAINFSQNPKSAINFNCNQRLQYPKKFCGPMNTQFVPNFPRTSQPFMAARPPTTMPYTNFQTTSVNPPCRNQANRSNPVLKISPNFNNSMRCRFNRNRPSMC